MTKGEWGPLLAADAKNAELRFPLIGSPKLDGIRCVTRNESAMSRSMKPIANRHVRSQIEKYYRVLENVDGELMVGDIFNSTTSGINTHAGEPNFTYHLFDRVSDDPFHVRFKSLSTISLPPFCKIVPHTPIRSQEELETFYERMLLQGFEGVMLRDPYGRYKCGRSTEKEGILFKLKPFEDSEALVIGFEELMHNENEQTVNELGYSHRSTKQEGKVPGNTLGKFLVVGTQDGHFGGIEFKIGTGKGLTKSLRQEIWNNKEKFLGKLVKFKYQKIGSIDKPRIPIFLGFRDKDDL